MFTFFLAQLHSLGYFHIRKSKFQLQFLSTKIRIDNVVIIAVGIIAIVAGNGGHRFHHYENNVVR